MDAIHYSVRKDGVVVKKAVYLAIGIDKEGRKEVLGFWIGENESSKYWLNVLNELKNRGVQDILIMSVDNLKGFSEAISSVFPKTEIQKCVVHQIRNSIRYISYKDVREFTSDLKEMYNAPTLEQVEFKLDELEEKWGKKYMAVINSWRSNWNELTTYFKYDTKIRKLIFTILFEYQHTAASFVVKTYGISKATVYNLVNSFEMPKLNIERFEKDDDSLVYMEIDEDHMKCRRSRNTYMRMVVIHRGIEKLCKNRNKLIDKHMA